MSTTTTPPAPDPNPTPTPEPTPVPAPPTPTPAPTESAAQANAAVAEDIVSDVQAAKGLIESPEIQAAKQALWSASATFRQRLHQLLADAEEAEKVDLQAVRKALGI